MDAKQARQVMAAINAIVGSVYLLAPAAGERAFGLEAEEGSHGRYTARYFGARSLIFAALFAEGGEVSRQVAKRWPVLAAVDGVANLLAAVRGEVPPRALVQGAAASAAAVALCIAATAED